MLKTGHTTSCWDACEVGELSWAYTGSVTLEYSLAVSQEKGPTLGAVLTPTEAEHAVVDPTPQQSSADQASPRVNLKIA